VLATSTTLGLSVYSRLHVSALRAFIRPFLKSDTGEYTYCLRTTSLSLKKGKNKFLLEQGTNAQRGSRYIALLFP
jgi:hypothetical protein